MAVHSFGRTDRAFFRAQGTKDALLGGLEMRLVSYVGLRQRLGRLLRGLIALLPTILSRGNLRYQSDVRKDVRQSNYYSLTATVR